MFAGKTNFLFDLDDTLIDSGAVHEAAYRHMFALHAPEHLVTFDYAACRGRTTADVLRAMGYGEDIVTAMSADKQVDYRRRIEAELKTLPNALDLLRHLRGEKKLYLVTGSTRDSALKALNVTGLDGFFAGVVTGGDAPRSKPAPDLYLYCLEKYRLDPASCLAIEDSEHGAVAARGAGIAVVGVHNSAIASLCDASFPDLFALGATVGQAG